MYLYIKRKQTFSNTLHVFTVCSGTSYIIVMLITVLKIKNYYVIVTGVYGQRNQLDKQII